MDLSKDFWELIAALFTVGAALLAPVIWFVQHYTGRLELHTTAAVGGLKADVSDLRLMIDGKFSDVYTTIDHRIGELRLFVGRENDRVYSTLNTLTTKVDHTQQEQTRIALTVKDLELKMQTDFVRASDLQRIMTMTHKQP